MTSHLPNRKNTDWNFEEIICYIGQYKELKKTYSLLLLSSSIIASLFGLFLFIFLFVLDFNVYWLILTPIIFSLYQAPAAYLFWLYKKTKQ